MGKKKKSKAKTEKTGAYEFEVHPPGTLSLEDLDLSQKVEDKSHYKKSLKELQHRLYRLQIEQYLQKKRAIFVFEGRDAAGKGGSIKRLTWAMDARGYKVWPIAAPKDAETRHHYLWRFWTRTPECGELCIFDRSWYGRVLVERVEGYATEDEWRRAYDEINAFEKMLTDDGIALAKFFIQVDRKTQLARFRAREGDPLKQYKLGPDDWLNRAKWPLYEVAIQDMLDRTHRPDAPWALIPGNDKKFARLEVLRTCIRVLEKVTGK